MQNDLIPADVDITEEAVTQASEQVAEEPVAYTSEEAAAEAEVSEVEVSGNEAGESEAEVFEPEAGESEAEVFEPEAGESEAEVFEPGAEVSGTEMEESPEKPVLYEAEKEKEEVAAYEAANNWAQNALDYTAEEEEAPDDESEAELAGNGQSRVYAGFFTRLTAYLLDKLILLIPLGLVRLIMFFVSMAVNVNVLHRQVFFRVTPADMILYSITAIYFILMTYLSGRTIGKRIMRIQVVSTEDRKPAFLEILFRETFGRFLSAFILGIGYLMIIAGKEKQALHDHLADTRVIFDYNR